MGGFVGLSAILRRTAESSGVWILPALKKAFLPLYNTFWLGRDKWGGRRDYREKDRLC